MLRSRTVKLESFRKDRRILAVFAIYTQNAACPAHGGLRSLISGRIHLLLREDPERMSSRLGHG